MGMFSNMNDRISRLQQGLQPDALAYWHRTILRDAKSMAPPWLQDKISISQDEHLPMKFHLDISKRVAKYYMMAVEQNLPEMPQSTQMYFLRVCESLGSEMDRGLV